MSVKPISHGYQTGAVTLALSSPICNLNPSRLILTIYVKSDYPNDNLRFQISEFFLIVKSCIHVISPLHWISILVDTGLKVQSSFSYTIYKKNLILIFFNIKTFRGKYQVSVRPISHGYQTGAVTLALSSPKCNLNSK